MSDKSSKLEWNEPKQERSKEMVGAIFEAATQVLATEGFDGSTTNRVAEKAGVSIGSFYRYFPSKEALVGVLFKVYFERSKARIEERMKLIDKVSPAQLVEVVVDGTMTDALKNRGWMKPLMGFLNRIDGVNTAVQSRATIARVLMELIEKHPQMIPPGKSPELVASMFVNMVSGILESLLASESNPEREKKIIAETVEMFQRYLQVND